MSDKETSTSFSQQPSLRLVFLADELPEREVRTRGRPPRRDRSERREWASPRLRSLGEAAGSAGDGDKRVGASGKGRGITHMI